MMLTQARYAPPLDQDVSVIQGSPADLDDLERRLRPSCERSEPRPRAMADRRGWLSPAERTNRWPLADATGDATPSAFSTGGAGPCGTPRPSAMSGATLLCRIWGPRRPCGCSPRPACSRTGATRPAALARTGGRPAPWSTARSGGLGSAGQLGQAVPLVRCLGPRRGPPIAPAADRRASRTRAALKPPQVQWVWIRMQSGVGTGGSGRAPWPWGRWPC
jgi:hypothetical protein